MPGNVRSKILATVAILLTLLLAGVFPCFADASIGSDAAADGNINVTVPTEAPMTVDASGEVMMASARSMAIVNNGQTKVKINGVSATSPYRDIALHVKSGTGSTADTAWFDFNGSQVTTEGATRELEAGATLQTAWSVDKLDAAKNKDLLDAAAKGKATFAKVTFTLEESDVPTGDEDFAVYSADDNGLRLYHRAGVPSAGETFDGRAATKVFDNLSKSNRFSSYAKKVATVAVIDDGVAPTAMQKWFFNFVKLTSADLSKLDTSNVTDMSLLFSGCAKLTSIDLSGFDTSKVTEMNAMFQGCKALPTLDISSFNTSSVTTMANMFASCSALSALDLSRFDTANLTTMVNMFHACTSLPSLDLSSFIVNGGTQVTGMFNSLDTSTFKSITVGTGWNVSSFDCDDNGIFFYYYLDGDNTVREVGYKFIPTGVARTYYSNRGDVPVPVAITDFAVLDDTGTLYIVHGNDVPAEGDQFRTYGKTVKTFTDLGKAFPFREVEDRVQHVNVADNVKLSGESMYGMFAEMKYLQSVDLANLDTSNVKNMGFMFTNDFQLESVDLSSFDTSKATFMAGMFKGCSRLASIELGNFDTSNVTSMSSMFEGCSKLANLDLSSFDTSKVGKVGFNTMFSSQIKSVTVGTGWNLTSFTVDPAIANLYYLDNGSVASVKNGEITPIESGTRTYYTNKGDVPVPTNFVVYSADDNGLRLYHRAGVPTEGETFDGHTATKVLANLNMVRGNIFDSVAGQTESVTVVDEGIAPSSMDRWFFEFSNLTSADLSKLDTSNVTDMSLLFYGCAKLTSLNLSGFNTSRVTTMENMFNGCTSLTSLDLSSFIVGSDVQVKGMFKELSAKTLKKITVGTGWNVSSFDCDGSGIETYYYLGDDSTAQQVAYNEIPTGVARTYYTDERYVPAVSNLADAGDGDEAVVLDAAGNGVAAVIEKGGAAALDAASTGAESTVPSNIASDEGESTTGPETPEAPAAPAATDETVADTSDTTLGDPTPREVVIGGDSALNMAA